MHAAENFCKLQTLLKLVIMSESVWALGWRWAAGNAYQLVCQHERCLEAELPVAEVEEILQTRAQQVQDHDIVVALHSVPFDVWNASCTA